MSGLEASKAYQRELRDLRIELAASHAEGHPSIRGFLECIKTDKDGLECRAEALLRRWIKERLVCDSTEAKSSVIDVDSSEYSMIFKAPLSRFREYRHPVTMFLEQEALAKFFDSCQRIGSPLRSDLKIRVSFDVTESEFICAVAVERKREPRTAEEIHAEYAK